MTEKLLNIKMEDTSSSTEICGSNATYFDWPAVKVKVENDLISEGGGVTDDAENGLRTVKTEKADVSLEDTTPTAGSIPVRSGSNQCIDTIVLTKGEDFFKSSSFVSTLVSTGISSNSPIVKVEGENRLKSEGGGTDYTENRVGEVKTEKADASEDWTSSAENLLFSTNSSQFVDTSALTKEEDLGMDLEEEGESANIGSDICASDEEEESCRKSYIFLKTETNQEADEFGEVKGRSQKCANSSTIDAKSVNCDKSDNLQGDTVRFGGKPFSCTYCTASFQTKQLFKQHADAHSTEKPFGCTQCSSKFKMKSHLNDHLTTHSDERPFSCSQCNSKFKTRRTLKAHLHVHSSERPYLCAHCPASFKTRTLLISHVFVHSDKKQYTCSRCSATFARKSQLELHSFVHSSRKLFICVHCPKRFTHKENLKEHLAAHSSEKLFTCAHCPARFNRKDHVKRHLAVHSRKKLLICSLCPARFTWKSDMKNHLAIHSNERPFTCPHCLSNFKIKSSLNRHLLIHVGKNPFTCSYCSFSFNDRSNLKRHLLAHTGEKPYSCALCAASFRKKDHTRKHMVAVHLNAK